MAQAVKQTGKKKRAKKARARGGSASATATLDISGGQLLLFACLAIAVAWSGLMVVDAAQSTRNLYQALGEVQREHDALLEENSRLSLERSTLSSLPKIEQVAQEQLDMEFPVQVNGVQP